MRESCKLVNRWIVERLAMGHASTGSRLAKAGISHASMPRKLERADLENLP